MFDTRVQRLLIIIACHQAEHRIRLLGNARGESLELFVSARSDASLRIAGDDFGRQTGRVLYHTTLYRPTESADATP